MHTYTTTTVVGFSLCLLSVGFLIGVVTGFLEAAPPADVKERARLEALREAATPPRWVSPDDVEKVRFTTTRLKAGYDEDEVDAFLDNVWWTVRRHELDRTHAAGYLACVDDHRSWTETADLATKAKEVLAWPPTTD